MLLVTWWKPERSWWTEALSHLSSSSSWSVLRGKQHPLFSIVTQHVWGHVHTPHTPLGLVCCFCLLLSEMVVYLGGIKRQSFIMLCWNVLITVPIASSAHVYPTSQIKQVKGPGLKCLFIPSQNKYMQETRIILPPSKSWVICTSFSEVLVLYGSVLQKHPKSIELRSDSTVILSETVMVSAQIGL